MLADNADAHLKGVLYLDLTIHHVVFNEKGKYCIKLSISSSRGDLRKVKLYLGNLKQSIFEYEYTSQPCFQDGLDIPCQLDDRQFRFEMPEEFSEGEVILLFETLHFTDNPLEEPFKCGEGKFLVFPCASPMQNSEPSTSADLDVCYNYTTQITLNKLLTEEQLYVNVGHVQITVKLQIDQEQAMSTNMSLSSKRMVNDTALASGIQGPLTRHNILPTVDTAVQQPVLLQRNPPTLPLPMINQQSNATSDVSQRPLAQAKAPTDTDSTTLSIMERQAKELEKHRYAMKKMADDILKLRSEATRLQAANSRLRLQHDPTSQPALSLPIQLQNTTHGELVQRIVIIKGSLDEQCAINRELKLEVHSLQNQLIKKNEKEKDLYKLQEAHKNQQMLLQKMQERLRRTKTLEETCKRQEKVILRLEEILGNSKAKEKAKKSEDEQAVEETLLDENKRLRTLVSNYERTSKAAVEEMERLHMHEKLQRAEGRVAALEKELLENTRRWARDKAELQLKLSESQISQSGQWRYQNLFQEPFSVFDRTPPDSVNIHSDSRRSSPKLSPLTKK